MKALKVKFCLIAALCIALAATLLTSVILFVKADRSVTVSGTSIFTTAGNSEVWAHRDGADSDSPAYSMFVFKKDDDAINYKKNLAFKWYENSAVWEDKEKAPTTLTKADGYFNMEIGFEELGYERFVITFESQQYYGTKDGKTVNYLYFVPVENDNVDVYVTLKTTEDKDAEEAYKHAGEKIATVAKDHIKICVTEITNGNCLLKINETAAGKLENFGGNYAKYSSSSVTPVTPLSFKAKFAEEAENASAKMALYNLNGQSFALTGATETDGHLSGGTVNDVTPPVLCLDKGVSFIADGEEISFDYTVIDVLASSPSTTTAYYMLTNAQWEKGEEFNATDCSDEGPFRTVKSDEEQRMIPHVNHYIPNGEGQDPDYDKAIFNEDFAVTAAVKVYLKLTDTTSTGGQSTYVLLDWYVEDEYLLDIKGTSYIAVAKDEVGATFAYMDSEKDWDGLKAEYQDAVNAAAEEQELKAGSKNSFYLPSVDSLLSDNATKYSDLSFTIFYMTDGSGSFQSLSGKAANALSINLSKAGRYVFTVVATDTSGNKMYYLKPGDDEDEKVEISTSTSDILSMYEQKKGTDFENTKQYLPWFEFEVASSTIEITDPGEQDTAYVGTTYSSISFEVNGVSYDTTYRLYLFRNDLYYAANGVSLTYDEFMAQKEELITSHREWFTYIYATNKMNEGDEEYEEFKDYAWDDSSLSFVPQDANAFYLIECTATSTENGKQADKAYMGVSASPKVRDIKGEDTWLQDNMTSVILLCIAGASLVGIVLLLVIKPKNKGDLDEEFETSKN